MAEENKVSGEIEDMLNALGDPAPKDSKDEKEEEVEEEKDEVKEEKESSEEKEEVKEEEKAEEEGEEKKEEVVEDEDAQRKEKEAAKEKETLDNLATEKEAREKEEEATRLRDEADKKKDEPLKLEDQDFIGDLDLDELTRDKVALNKILNSVYSKGVNDSKRLATEGIPDIVKHNLTLLTSLKEASDNFYKENNDLTPFKRVVAAVFEDIAAKNPGKKYNELMNLVAPEARKRLNLSKQAGKAEKGNGDGEGNPPRLHGVKGNQRQAPLHKPNKTALENEISEMNKVIGR